MHTCGEWPVEAWRPNGWRVVSVGVRAIEIDTRGRARATNEFLRYASGAVGAAVDLDAERLIDLLGGATQPLGAHAQPGAVALRHAGEIVGRGLHTREGLVSHVPKARAQDLARALTGE
jgi:hypothetical protein